MRIALLGYGIEGESAYHYLRAKYPGATFVVYDQSANPKQPLPEGIKFEGGRADFYDIAADLVVRTPSIRPDAVSTMGEVTSVTRLFFEACPAPIIGVTGSKGKGTTSSLIANILRAGGYTTHLVGNIGEPALDALEDMTENDIVVYELSSFQLWDLENSPHIAVVLMIEPDHLDIHASMEEYVAAKSNIVRYQKAEDMVVYNAINPLSTEIAELSAGQKIPYPANKFVHVQELAFYYGDRLVCETGALKLPGAHNIENACAAIAAAWPWVQDGKTIAQGLSAFDGLPHRLKFVREVGGVNYYDDSIATTPGSAIAALDAFEAPKVMILGGSSKGADFTALAEKIAKSNIRCILLMGEEADAIAAALEKTVHKGSYCLMRAATMREIVAKAEEMAEPGDVVVLSPACASFGVFKNYKDRGEQFIAAVNEL